MTRITKVAAIKGVMSILHVPHEGNVQKDPQVEVPGSSETQSLHRLLAASWDT
jgi:hypothetical protein